MIVLAIVSSLVFISIPLFAQEAEGYILIFEKLTHIEEVEIVKIETNHNDYAWAEVTGPGFSATAEHTDGHPSVAEVWSPPNPAGGKYGGAKGWGHGCIPRRWTACAVQSGTGYVAKAKASASHNIRITNLVAQTIIVTWRIIFRPYHDNYNYIFYEEGATGLVTLKHTITDITHELPLLESTTEWTGNDGPHVIDDTGQLIWFKEPYERWNGEIYDNAYMPCTECEIPLMTYEMELDPYETVEMAFELEFEEGIESEIGEGSRGNGLIGQEMVPFILDPPPETPVITGETKGNVGEEYEYTFTSVDAYGDQLDYYIDWGDGTFEDWFGSFPSGQDVMKKHTYNTQGDYTIKAKARDIHGSESDLGTLTATMPRNKAINRPFLQFLLSHPNIFPILRLLLRL